jgi:hypothetical protein
MVNSVKSKPPKAQPYYGKQISYDIESLKTTSYDQNVKIFQSKSALLMENLPFFGLVPLVFYLPQGTPQEYLDEILAHGGQITNIVECFTIMLSLIPKRRSAYDDGFSKDK